jgi:hypothetical protein
MKAEPDAATVNLRLCWGRPTLSDYGITRDQSSQWQRLAKVPQPEFEAALAGEQKPTINGIIENGRRP